MMQRHAYSKTVKRHGVARWMYIYACHNVMRRYFIGLSPASVLRPSWGPRTGWNRTLRLVDLCLTLPLFPEGKIPPPLSVFSVPQSTEEGLGVPSEQAPPGALTGSPGLYSAPTGPLLESSNSLGSGPAFQLAVGPLPVGRYPCPLID